MELFEKINRAFGGWYEGLFGGSDDVRPRDILRRILAAMEEHRKEGIDGKVYVPNQYVLEIAVDDEEEKEYLLSFLDREELEAAIRRYCQQNHYNIRGGLDFTIKEVDQPEDGKRREKVRVRCRYDSKLAAERPAASPPPAEPEAAPAEFHEALETVYDTCGSSDEGTVPGVPLARLVFETMGEPSREVPINKSGFTIGRSSRAANDLILDHDGMVSRRHSRIELEADGKFTIYDLDTTNGTRVNGKKVDNKTLSSGDEIVIGATRMRFFQSQNEPSSPISARSQDGGTLNGTSDVVKARLVLTDGNNDLDSFILGSETVVGRGATNDIVLADRSVATRHILLRRGNPFTVEPMDGDALTLLNGTPIPAGTQAILNYGDRIGIGAVTMRLEAIEQ